jgi:uncharacterized RDD family membrane protein YckC
VTMYPPPPQGAPQVPQTFGASGPRAGFWVRFGALLIDSIIIAIIPIILIAIGSSSNSSGILALGYVLYIVGAIAYYVYFEGGPTGQTLGKSAMGIRVIDFNTGGSIGHGRAFVRWIGRIVSGFLCYLGYFWMLWDKEKQCWHDKMANDVVVPTQYYPVN